jgi:hypothetical protein
LARIRALKKIHKYPSNGVNKKLNIRSKICSDLPFELIFEVQNYHEPNSNFNNDVKKLIEYIFNSKLMVLEIIYSTSCLRQNIGLIFVYQNFWSILKPL